MTSGNPSAASPTAILSEEHQVILVVLNALESLIAGTESETRLEEAEARELVGFFRGFADRFHHAKEEACLFPVLEQRGIPCEQGPIGVMLREHEEGRACVRAMDETAGPAAAGDSEALVRFIAAGRRFIPLLRGHIEKEDLCLFSMAEQVLSDQDRTRLAAAFRDADDRQADPEAHQQYLALARRLSEGYAVPRTPLRDAPRHPAACGH